jgi:hypothetical protein
VDVGLEGEATCTAEEVAVSFQGGSTMLGELGAKRVGKQLGSVHAESDRAF